MKKLLFTLFLMFLCVSCMTDKEYQLRKSDIKAKAAWPATYQPVRIKGPLMLDKDSELIVTVPNQPYQHASIPDGQAIQAKLASDVLHTGALLGGAIYSINKANKGNSGDTISTTNNYSGGAQ